MDSRSNLAGKKVVVGMTGRMDSAMAAFLLKKQGMQVIGLSIVTVSDDIVDDSKYLPACHIRDLDTVQNLCKFLNIPFYATNARPRFEEEVVDNLVSNKLLGKANSSCFDCTRTRMKVLYSKMEDLEADFIATGHYAKVRMNLRSKNHYICTSGEENSDQSFLLAGTPNYVLEKLLLPLGELSKKEVAKYVKHFALPISDPMAMTDFCFSSRRSSKKIIADRVPKSLIRQGNAINVESGTTIGEHAGMANYYITEKEPFLKGGGHIDKDLEVVAFDYASSSLLIGKGERLRFSGAQLSRLSTVEGLDRSGPMQCFVKFKYSKKFAKADLFFKNNDCAFIQFYEPAYPLVENEAVVLYENASSSGRVIGWALVGARGDFELVNRVKSFEDNDVDEDQSKPAPTLFRF
ncbi:MAG: hypothetical protein CMJ16_08755 [Peredibacter sp.]|mgnify:FL=1|nr:hypothetical protein [Peredibacter sp.]